MSAPAGVPAAMPKHKTARSHGYSRYHIVTISDLILMSVAASKDRKGVSFHALKKDLAARGFDVQQNNARIKKKVKVLLNKGALIQTSGRGLNGSFKIGIKVLKQKGWKTTVKPSVRKDRKTPNKKTAAAARKKRKIKKKKKTGRKAKVRAQRRKKARPSANKRAKIHKMNQPKVATSPATNKGKIHKKTKHRGQK